MKGAKLIVSLVSAVVLVGAAICAVVIYQEELTKLFQSCTDYCKNAVGAKKEEYEDYADV